MAFRRSGEAAAGAPAAAIGVAAPIPGGADPGTPLGDSSCGGRLILLAAPQAASWPALAGWPLRLRPTALLSGKPGIADPTPNMGTSFDYTMPARAESRAPCRGWPRRAGPGNWGLPNSPTPSPG